MKIAIDSTTLNHTRSGLFTYTEGLLRGLAEVDAENEYTLLFTSLRRSAAEMPGPLKKNFLKKVLRVPDRQFPGRNILMNRIVLPGFLHCAKCKIYHAPAGYLLPKIAKIGKILTIHDLRTAAIHDNVLPQNLAIYRISAQKADICITPSKATRRDIVEYFVVSPEKVRVIYEGVDERFLPIDREIAKSYVQKKFNLKGGYFLCLGGIPRKNIERLIRAFGLFKYKKEFLLVLGGAGWNGPWVKSYHRLIDELGIKECVKAIGFVSDEDLIPLYNGAKAFVFPSLYEGFGLPVIEAMGCGVPVITSNVSALPEVGGDAAYYVDPYNVEEIAKGMEKIIEDKGLQRNLVEKGFQRAKQFSWRKMAEETLSVYKEVATLK